MAANVVGRGFLEGEPAAFLEILYSELYCHHTNSEVRDVLLRHHQSCRAAKAGSFQVAQNTKRTKRAYQTDTEPKSSDERCGIFTEPAQNCTYVTTGPESNKQLPSPRTDRSQEPEEDGRYISPGFFHNSIQRDPSLTQNSGDGIFISGQTESGNSEPQMQEGSNSEIQHTESSNRREELLIQQSPTDFFIPSGIHNARNQSKSADEQSLKERRPANKRGRYVSNAW
jgi:hypothetical protein